MQVHFRESTAYLLPAHVVERASAIRESRNHVPQLELDVAPEWEPGNGLTQLLESKGINRAAFDVRAAEIGLAAALEEAGA